MLASSPRSEISKSQVLHRVAAIVAGLTALYTVARLLPPLDLLSASVVIVSTLLTVQSLFSSYLMLYAWERPDRMEQTRGPRTFLQPQHRFAVLLPARHEEIVIYETIRKLTTVDYPSELVEILVIRYADDQGTIAEARRAIDELGAGQ